MVEVLTGRACLALRLEKKDMVNQIEVVFLGLSGPVPPYPLWYPEGLKGKVWLVKPEPSNDQFFQQGR